MTIKHKLVRVAGLAYRPKRAWQAWYRAAYMAHTRALAAPYDAHMKAALHPANGVRARFVGGDASGGDTADWCRYVAALLPPEAAGNYAVKIRMHRDGIGVPAHFVFGVEDPLDTRRSFRWVQAPAPKFHEYFSVRIPTHTRAPPVAPEYLGITLPDWAAEEAA